jgi:hypothetical protein
MKIARLLIIVAALGFAADWWSGHKGTAPATAQVSPNGFVPTVTPNGAPANTVLVLAPLNCPSAEAQRADALSQELTRMGIRNVRSSSFSLSVPNPTDEDKAGVDRAVAILNAGAPAVFINGMGKSNPSAEEVVSEYDRTRP